MFKSFITRPVLAIVVSLVFILLGAVSLARLPLTLYPDIAAPCVYVEMVYPGANSETMLRSVAPIVEEAINGVENMNYMQTSISNSGYMVVMVYFNIGTDPDVASVLVQNRVSTITSRLPQEVVRHGITTQKMMNSMIYVAGYNSESPDYDEAFLQNYMNINVFPELRRITGVGKLMLFSSRDYAMRVWIDPDRLATYNISVEEINGAIAEQNIEIAPGNIGETSKQTFQYNLTYRGKFTTPEEYRGIILRTNADGSFIRLGDVAHVELGSLTYTTASSTNSHPGALFAIFQTSGSNANDIITEVERVLEQKKKDLPPNTGIQVLFSSKQALQSAIGSVTRTLIEAFWLVFLIVFFFLYDWRSTIIIGLAIPVSIIGTFLMLQAMGMSLNLLTLFALVISVGIVVDDAVVVIEAVFQKRARSATMLDAATGAMGEITNAVVSSTLVMIAVFAPVAFVEGSVGRFYQQFSITMMTAIGISGITALTLCPALAAILLRTPEEEAAHKGFFYRFQTRASLAFNRRFSSLRNGYLWLVRRGIRHRKIFAGVVVLIFALLLFLFKQTPKGFIPTEDDGFYFTLVDLPSATTVGYTEEVLRKMEKVALQHPAVKATSFVAGFDMMSQGENSSAGCVFICLKEVGDRPGKKNIYEVMAEIDGQLAGVVNEGVFFSSKPSSVPGFDGVGGVNLVMLDPSAGSLSDFKAATDAFMARLASHPYYGGHFMAFKTDFPRFRMEIDHEKAKLANVRIDRIGLVLQANLGSLQAGDFPLYGKSYRIVIQSSAEQRKTVEALNSLYVQSDDGKSHPLRSFVRFVPDEGPATITRFNMYNAISVGLYPAPGVSTNQLMSLIAEEAEAHLPSPYDYSWSGISREEQRSESATILIFVLSFALVYLILAGLYESFLIPVVILLSVPTALVGVLLGVNAMGLDNNIFVQIAMMMLIGLVAKNAILIVEHALHLRRRGLSPSHAAVLAARSRMRPVLMTSIATLLGVTPMLFVVGPSGFGNFSIGLSVVCGLLTGIVGSLILTPVLFVGVSKLLK